MSLEKKRKRIFLRERSQWASVKEFKGIRGNYQGTLINVKENILATKRELRSKRVPVFVGAKGEFYDLHYLPIPKEEIEFRETTLRPLSEYQIYQNEENHTKEGKLKLLSENKPKSFDNLIKFPDPEDYNTFEEFERASIEWKYKAQEQLGIIKIPEPISGQLYNLKEREAIVQTNTETIKTEQDYENSENITIDEDETNTETDMGTDEEDNIGIKLEDVQFEIPIEKELGLIQLINNGLPKERKKLSHEFKDYLLAERPWDTHFIPAEPKPEYYLTLQEYERTCRRWAQIVIKNLQKVPMHPRQLQQQALLKPYKKRIRRSFSSVNSENYFRGHFEWINAVYKQMDKYNLATNFNSLNIFSKNLRNEMENKKDNYKSPLKKNTQDKNSFIWDTLSLSTQKKLTNFTKKIYKRTKHNNKTYSNNTGIILGRYLATTGTTSENKAKLYLITSPHLLRTDIDTKTAKIRKPQPNTKKKSKNIQYIIPEYNLEFSIPWKELFETEKYDSYEKEINNLNDSFRFKQFYRKYSIEKYNISFHKNNFQQVNKITDKKDFNIDDLIEIINSDIYFDEFKKLFRKNEKKKYSELYLGAINTENFANILELFDNSPKLMIHAKKFGKESLLIRLRRYFYLRYYLKVIENYILKTISKVKNNKKTTKFHENLKATLDKYNNEFSSKIIRVITKKAAIVVEQLFKGFCCRSLQTSIFCFFLITRLIKMNNENIIKMLIKKNVNFNEWLLKTVVSKFTNTKKSSLLLWFTLIENGFKTYFVNEFTSDSFPLVNILFGEQPTFKRIADEKENKMKAVTFRRSSLQKIKLYLQQNRELFDDFQDDEKSENLKLINKKNIYPTPAFKTVFALEMLLFILKYFEKHSSFERIILNNKFFQNEFYRSLIARLEKNIMSTKAETLSYVDFFFKYVKCITKLNLVATKNHPIDLSLVGQSPRYCNDNQKNSKKSTNHYGTLKLFKFSNSKTLNRTNENTEKLLQQDVCGIVFAKEDIIRVLDLVQNTDPNNKEFKTKLLNGIKHLITHRGVFLMIYKEPIFFERIKNFCLNSDNFKFNKTAWRIFFKLVLNHSECLNHLIETDQLKYFVSPPNSLIPITNQLYYLNKLFQLPNHLEKMMLKKNITNKKVKIMRYNVKDPLKSLTKDRRKIINYFIKKICYSRLHTLFKRFEKEFNSVAFANLASVYYTIMEKNYCSRLFNEFKSVEEYKTGIKFFNENKISVSSTKKSSKKKKKSFFFGEF
ncbi:sca1 complex scaffold protein scaa [Anaeramoeba flamelloides]|uniref:Sca1 complex scaffold protein scaa n=1 Tax=Anaeramoeba flamelloides TaxID=1746091 RepID=A0ABQ8YCE1_9EUKA|nr:sca1 complex scaffold protein scaa [Anaeramoeba flamelloides]